MSDDRRDDDFREYGSLFDEASGTGVVPQVGPDAAEVEFDDEFGDEGFGDVTWADEAPDVADHTDADNYQPPAESGGEVFYTEQVGAADGGSTTNMFDAVPASPGGSAWDDGEVIDEFDDDQPMVDGEDVDVWSSFSSESPVWDADGSPVEPLDQPITDSGQAQPRRVVVDDEPYGVDDRAPEPLDGQHAAPDRIQIGTDPAVARRDVRDLRNRDGRSGGRSVDGRRSGRGDAAGRSLGGTQKADSGGRDMPMAIAVGLLLIVMFVLVLRVDALKYWGIIAMVTLVVAVAAVEFFGRVTDKGYRPATVPGVAACVSAPLVAYWMGDAGLPLVITFGFVAIAISFIGANSVDSAPMPNIAITNLGMIWIGLLGSYAMLILRFSTANSVDWPSSNNFGTDTLFLLALGVVVNDTGALLVGSFVGRTPLRSWISPNKTVEGLIGGTAFTMIAMILYRQLVSDASTWTSYADLMILAVVISIMAPLGDLVESMYKRNMDIKDFGTIVRGHGGVLDRFDGFLFALPAVYYLAEVLQPWTAAG